MYPYPGNLPPEKSYHTAEGAALATAAALANTCVLPPPIQALGMNQMFSMNPNSYENLDNVDWAALAQQWIQMNHVMPPAAPPPPVFTTPGIVTRQFYEEKGEADMDVDMHHSSDEPAPLYEGSVQTAYGPWSNPPAPAWNKPPPQINTQILPGNNNFNNNNRGSRFNNQGQNNQNRQWKDNNQGNSRKGYMTGAIPPMPVAPGPPQLTESDIWTIPPMLSQEQSSLAAASHHPLPPRMYATSQSVFNVSSLQASSAAHPKDTSKRSDLMSSSNLALLGDVNSSEANADSTESALDAMKRKNLPAWIREGLEKMEREKAKQTEREKEQRDREEQLEMKKRVEKEAMEELQALKEQRAKEEEQFSEDEEEKEVRISKEKPKFAPVPRKRTAEEIMLLVRQTLTEILLEVTNEEIRSVSQEMKQRYQKKKAKMKANPIKIGGPNLLTQKLGLAAYADSDSENDDDDERDDGKDTPSKRSEESEESDVDSEEELKETIRQRKLAFRAEVKEMEEEMAEHEEKRRREKRRKRRSLGNSTNNDNSNHDSDDDEEEEEEDEDNEEENGASDSSEDGGKGRKSRSVGEEKRRKKKNGGKTERNNLNLINVRDGEPPQTFDKNNSRSSGGDRGMKNNRSSRFSDAKDTVRGSQVTHHVAINPMTMAGNQFLIHGASVVKDRSPQQSESSELAAAGGVAPSSSASMKRRKEDDDRSVASSSSSRYRDSKRRSKERTSTRRDRYEDDDEDRYYRREERSRRSRERDRDSSRRDKERDSYREKGRERSRRSRSKDGDRHKRKDRSRSRDRDRDSRKRRD